MKHKISVIIPAYDEEKHIEACLVSLVKQHPYEIIVIANACKDNTEKIAKRYTKVIRLKDLGIAKARNKGLDSASGDIIVHIDADSTASPNLLHEVSKAVDKGYFAGTCKVKPLTPSFRSNLFCFLLNIFTHIFITPHAFAFFRVDIHKKHRFDESLHLGEDTEHFKVIKHDYKVKFINSAFIKTSMRRFEKKGYIKTLLDEWLKVFIDPKDKHYTKVE